MDAQYEGLVRIILKHGDDADAKTNVRNLMMIVMMMMMTIIIVVTMVVITIVIDHEDRDYSR
jgi:hypothetical protein